jgi:hypothetical protein
VSVVVRELRADLTPIECRRERQLRPGLRLTFSDAGLGS